MRMWFYVVCWRTDWGGPNCLGGKDSQNIDPRSHTYIYTRPHPSSIHLTCIPHNTKQQPNRAGVPPGLLARGRGRRVQGGGRAGHAAQVRWLGGGGGEGDPIVTTDHHHHQKHQRLILTQYHNHHTTRPAYFNSQPATAAAAKRALGGSAEGEGLKAAVAGA